MDTWIRPTDLRREGCGGGRRKRLAEEPIYMAHEHMW